MSYLQAKLYISSVPKIPEYGINFTAEELYEYHKKQARSYEIENFNRPSFEKKFREFSIIQEQYDLLRSKAKEISRLSQGIFEIKFRTKQ